MNKFFIALAFLIVLRLEAQEAKSQLANAFTVEQAIAYALENNADYKNAQTDVEIAKNVVKETTAIGLPQLNGGLSNTNYIDIPTTLMPDFISPAVYGVNTTAFGLTPITPLPDEAGSFPVKFGTKYNANANISVSQLVFSGEYLIGLKASKTYSQQAAQMLIKTEQGLKEQVSKNYYFTLSLRAQKEVLEKTLSANEQLLAETRQLQAAGFVERTAVTQLEIMVNNLYVNVGHLQNQIQNSLDYLKMLLGMPLEEELILTESLSELINEPSPVQATSFELHQSIDFQMMETQRALAELQLKREQSTYLPQLSAFFNAETNAMRNKYNFFDSSETWFPTTVWGINLHIPIWSSGARSSRVQQAKLARNKLDESAKQLASVLTLEAQTAKNNLDLHRKEYQISQTNLALSEDIYSNTQTKFKEGVATSFDLIQAHNNFLTASGNYTLAILNVLNDQTVLKRILEKAGSSNQKK
ncbi:MAG: TolC family protein [Bacteroidales bacterium]|nr:TolC family protein [Bacteroidales bacterium]